MNFEENKLMDKILDEVAVERTDQLKDTSLLQQWPDSRQKDSTNAQIEVVCKPHTQKLAEDVQ